MKLSILNELFTTCWWWLLLWMFLAFLLGWFLRKLFGEDDNDCCDELEELKRKHNDLQYTYNKLKETPKATTASAIVAPKKPVKRDNLKVVEGIGPKIEQLFNKGGIYSWKQLSEADVNRLKEILKDEGPRFRMANPGTWPQQAKLADDGKWDELKKLQDKLDGGR